MRYLSRDAFCTKFKSIYRVCYFLYILKKNTKTRLTIYGIVAADL